MSQMGLSHILDVEGVPKTDAPTAAFGRMAELAPGKDTTTGHWEMAGAVLDTPLALFPDGFPEELIAAFREKTGRDVLGNCAASGTEIIARLGEQQRETGAWIVYTSADSVFQIAAHEELIPLDELYRACEIARDLVAPLHVGRVIARPYVGEPGHYTRTPNRKDYALDPPAETVLDRLVAQGVKVTGVGKIGNVYNHRGITLERKSKTNHEGMEITKELVQSQDDGLLFVNLVDFDSKFGHRNNPKGYGQALEEFVVQLGELLPMLREDDLLIITADHGCDPTVPGTDHSREYVPLLVQHSSLAGGTALGTRRTFADIAQSLASYWGLAPMPVGESFLP
jgi:phosphopentomutase